MSYTEPNEIGSKNGTNVSMVKVSVIRLSIVIAVLASLASATGLLSGVLGYFLYTYASYLFGVAYNQLFLLYAALVALSLFAFIGALEPSTWGVCRIGSPPAFRAVLSPADDMIVCVNRAVARTRRGGT